LPGTLAGVTRAAIVLSILALPSLALAQPAPPTAYFRYDLHRTVHDGRDAYDGYTDELVASGRYDVEITPSATSERTTVHAVYDWHFGSSERREQGHEDRSVEFDDVLRRYTSAQTDLDDYDSQAPLELATWVWIPPDVEVAAVVPILDHQFSVVQTDATVDVAGAPRVAIYLRALGTDTRDDDYGHFSTTFTDEYWFDAATGMFLREHYEEHDDGAFEHVRASFDVTEDVRVTDASYAPHVGELPPDPVEIAARTSEAPVPRSVATSSHSEPWLAIIVLVALGAAFLYFLFRRSSGRAPMFEGSPIQVAELPKGEPLPALPPDASIHFGPFLSHFAEIARRTGNEVVVASAGGRARAIGFEDRDTQVATIFAPTSDLCEQIRKKLDVKEFFSELRHGNLDSVMAATMATGEKLPSSHAYNVYETYEVLRLDAIPAALGFDSTVVTRLREADVTEAAALLDRALGVPCAAFLTASLELGDVGYCARVDGRIVGVALASLAGTTGRLHTLAVHPDTRGKGLGKELVRARLRALSELGATTVIAEIATWNLASLEIARAHGFVKVGDMYVESARSEKTEKRLVRR
jgi:GNAT superfamily N-acetyltransferase